MNHQKKKLFQILLLLLFIQEVNAYTISDPGYFTLGNSTYGEIVRISSNNVTLDLGGNTIFSASQGILIDSGLSRIKIFNGIIDSCTKGITIGPNCSSISINNIDIANCLERGVEILGTLGNEASKVTLEKVRFDNCATSTSADYLIHANYVQNLILEKLLMVNNGSSGVDIRMVNIQNSSRCIFKDIICQDNQALNFEGFHFENTINSLVREVEVRINTASATFVGFRFTGTATFENTCKNCVVSENICASGPLIGFDLLETVSKHMLDQCLVANNLTTGTTILSNCLGFNLDQVALCTLLKCRAISNSAMNDGTFNIAAGFHIGTSGGVGTGVKDSELSECVAANNKGYNDERSFGFRVVSDITGNTNNTYVGNIGIRNGVSTPYAQNQIVSTAGVGSSPGGVPSSSIVTKTTVNINNSGLGISNIRVI
jgi:hypothetical protein